MWVPLSVTNLFYFFPLLFSSPLRLCISRKGTPARPAQRDGGVVGWRPGEPARWDDGVVGWRPGRLARRDGVVAGSRGGTPRQGWGRSGGGVGAASAAAHGGLVVDGAKARPGSPERGGTDSGGSATGGPGQELEYGHVRAGTGAGLAARRAEREWGRRRVGVGAMGGASGKGRRPGAPEKEPEQGQLAAAGEKVGKGRGIGSPL